MGIYVESFCAGFCFVLFFVFFLIIPMHGIGNGRSEVAKSLNGVGPDMYLISHMRPDKLITIPILVVNKR